MEVSCGGMLPRRSAAARSCRLRMSAWRLLKHVARRGVFEIFAIIGIQLDQLGKEIPAERPQGRQEPVSRIQMQKVRLAPGHIGVPGSDPLFFLFGKDIGPIFPAGIQQKEAYRHPAGNLRNGLQIKARQVGYTEDRDSFRKIGGRGRGGTKGLDQGSVERGAVFGFVPGRQVTPEVCLPAGRRIAGFLARFPGRDQIGAENQVLVEKIGNFLGKLQEFQVAGIGCQIALQFFKPLGSGTLGQLPHNGEGQGPRFEKRLFGDVRQHPFENVVQKTVGERKGDVGADAVVCGERHRHPALHPAALDDDDFRRQGCAQGGANHLRQLCDQCFEAIAGDDLQAGFQNSPPLHIAALTGYRTLQEPRRCPLRAPKVPINSPALILPLSAYWTRSTRSAPSPVATVNPRCALLNADFTRSTRGDPRVWLPRSSVFPPENGWWRRGADWNRGRGCTGSGSSGTSR